MASGTDLIRKATDPSYYSGKIGAAFLASDMMNVASSDNKAKALLVTLKNLEGRLGIDMKDAPRVANEAAEIKTLRHQAKLETEKAGLSTNSRTWRSTPDTDRTRW